MPQPDLLPPESLALAEPAPQPGSTARTTGARIRGDGWLLALFLLIALGYAGLTAYNFERVAVAADASEWRARMAPENKIGRGACDALAIAQPPPMFDPDALCWINLTQEQYRQGTVRPHWFPFDNTPYGRGRHWSSSLSWWLLLLGAMTHAASGIPMEMAIAQAAAWANPILLGVFLTVLAIGLRRKASAWIIGALLVTFAASWGLEWDFSYGRPDHHGLHLMAYIGLLVAALVGGMGWVRVGNARGATGDDATPDSRRHLVNGGVPYERARFWLTVSAVCGGAGLWIGSTQQCFCVAVLGCGAVLSALLFGGNPREESRFSPELWRHWARVGAVTSLAFYLIEYFPGDLEMRLEVNSPLMALGWAGAGELMWAITTMRIDWPRARARGLEIALRAACGLAAMSALPLAIFLGPRSWWVVRDPAIAASASVISEGMPWLDWRHPYGALQLIWSYTGILLFLAPLAGVFVLSRRQPAARRSAILTGMLASALFLAWTVFQVRWIGFLEVSLAVLAIVAAPCLVSGGPRGLRLPMAILGVFAPGWIIFAALQGFTFTQNSEAHAKALFGQILAWKEVAWNLRLYSGGKPDVRVMSPPGPSPVLHYYGGVQTVGSYYWENFAACHTTLDFYAGAGEDVARRIVRERGLQYVVAVASPGWVMEMQMLEQGRVDVPAARRTLAFRLGNPMVSNYPDWLEPLPLLDAPIASAEGFRLFRVRTERL